MAIDTIIREHRKIVLVEGLFKTSEFAEIPMVGGISHLPPPRPRNLLMISYCQLHVNQQPCDKFNNISGFDVAFTLECLFINDKT